MLVTDRRRTRGPDWVDRVARAVAGGVGIVQVREKDLSEAELRAVVEKVRDRAPTSTCVIVNGSWRVARACRVGLHLPAGMARPETVGPGPVGRSAHDAAEVAAALAEDVDYIILGTLFPTPSKPGRAGCGVELLRELCDQAAPTPVYAIGGIQVSHVPALLRAGAYGVAVCGAILSSSDSRRSAEAFSLALEVAVGKDGSSRSS
jgi:thiamine-phosphate pyrophosphorylase